MVEKIIIIKSIIPQSNTINLNKAYYMYLFVHFSFFYVYYLYFFYVYCSPFRHENLGGFFIQENIFLNILNNICINQNNI